MKIDPYTIKWRYGQSRGKNHAVLFLDAVGTLPMKEAYPEKIYNFPYRGKYYLQSAGSRSIGEEDYEAMFKLLTERLKSEPDFFSQYGLKMTKLSGDIRTWADDIKEIDWAKLSNQQLAELIYQHAELMAQVWAVPLAYAYYFYFNDKIVEEFIEQARSRLGAKFDLLLPAILAQEKLSEIGEEKRELLVLALAAKQSGQIDPLKIKEHWHKFAHLNNYYFWGNGYSLEDMIVRLEDEAKKSETELKQELREFELKPLDYSLFTETEKIVIDSIKKMGHAFQHTDESLVYAIHRVRGLYHEAAKRLDITYNQLVSMLLSEVMASLKAGQLVVVKDILDERYDDHTIFVIEGESIIISGTEHQSYLAQTAIEDDSQVTEFKGNVAYKGGKITGRVHLIAHADEIPSFKQGEILVTPMTNPSFVPAMKKAAAIVTNDGGLLCHAAIVSRELRVPCVIGTKIATKVLKDGDLVEVDTDKGIIRKI